MSRNNYRNNSGGGNCRDQFQQRDSDTTTWDRGDHQRRFGAAGLDPPVDNLFDMPDFTGTKPSYRKEKSDVQLARFGRQSQNFDFSSFPLIVEQSYSQLEILEPRLRSMMPFCIYNHSCTELLNAVLLGAVINAGGGSEEFKFGLLELAALVGSDDALIHEPLHAYLQHIANTTGCGGDEVLLNLPEAGTPQTCIGIYNPEYYIIPSGSFGPCDAKNHNAYECYASPYVSRRLVEETLAQNTGKPRDDHWQPLPERCFPKDAVPNTNLIGWRPCEYLNHKGINQLRGLNFANDDGAAGRLAHCPEIMARCYQVLETLRNKVKIREGYDGILKSQTTTDNVGYLYYEPKNFEEEPGRLCNHPANVRSPINLSAANSCATGLFGLKRERHKKNPGYCYTYRYREDFHRGEDKAIAGWEDTINDNFNMKGSFANINKGKDNVSSRLLKCNFVEYPDCNRVQLLASWMRKKFLLKQL